MPTAYEINASNIFSWATVDDHYVAHQVLKDGPDVAYAEGFSDLDREEFDAAWPKAVAMIEGWIEKRVAEAMEDLANYGDGTLSAEKNGDGEWEVADTAGGEWLANAEAQKDIESHPWPELRALEICCSDARRGTWYT